MAEEGDDAHGNVVEERNQILQLQSEQFRKQEQLDRLRQRSRALEEELQTREAELSEVARRCHEEKHHSAKHVPGEDRARAALAEDHFLRNEVQRLLQSRVPAMAPITEEGEEDGNPLETASAPKQEDPSKQLVHDTVLVSYVQSQDGRQEDYKVSYRIDGHTTVEQLHRDACAYWGCSRKDYTLWKIDADDKPTSLFPPKAGEQTAPKLLQDTEVLNPAEAAHLHLCRDSDEIRKARQKERESERKERERKAQAAEKQGPEQRKSHDVLKTLKRGLGYATNDKQPEEFVDAFRPWPGVYHLLATRGRAPHHKNKWRPAWFSDILGYLFLILLSALCIGYRSETDVFLLREGVLRSLVEGIRGETFDSMQGQWILQASGSTSAKKLVSISPGMTVDVDAVRVNGSMPGQHFARAGQGLGQDIRALQLSGNWVPPVGACANFSLMIAAGLQPPAATAPRFSIAWGCSNASIVGANGSMVVSSAQACSNFSSTGGRATVSFARNGSVSLSAGAGCSLSLEAGQDGNWSDLGQVDPLLLFFQGDGGGAFQNITLMGTVPAPVRSFTSVATFTDLRRWVTGQFLYQLLEPSSTLMRQYRKVTSMRIRQQMAKAKSCAREQVPFNLQRKCNEVVVGSADQEKATIPPSHGLPLSARTWQQEPVGTVGLYGEVQRYYSGAGYAMDIPLRNLTLSHLTFVTPKIDAAFSGAWLSAKTRLLSVEILLENLDLGGHVVVNLFVEITPGGALHPMVDLKSARLAPSYGGDVAHGLDIARWVVVVVLLLGVRMYRETKRKMQLGRHGLTYILSLAGILDLTTVAVFMALQFIRLSDRPQLPERTDVFRSYSQVADTLQQLAALEAVFLLLLILRLLSFMRFFPPVYRFFKSFGRALRMFGFYLTMFVPVFLGNAFLATAIFSPYIFNASTFLRSFRSLVVAVKESHNVEILLMKSTWTLPFLMYFWLSIVAFFLFGFLAISVHAFFEVQLVEGSDPNAEQWSFDDWRRWMLWQPVYNKVVRGAASEKKVDGETDGELEEEEDSSDEDDHEEKRG